MFWNVHCIGKVVLKNKFNFTSAIIRSERYSCSHHRWALIASSVECSLAQSRSLWTYKQTPGFLSNHNFLSSFGTVFPLSSSISFIPAKARSSLPFISASDTTMMLGGFVSSDLVGLSSVWEPPVVLFLLQVSWIVSVSFPSLSGIVSKGTEPFFYTIWCNGHRD